MPAFLEDYTVGMEGAGMQGYTNYGSRVALT
jgi:hypothetical protein